MRIIAGANRGTRLMAPKGRATRPTADRARESLFSMLEGGRIRRADGRHPVTGMAVLDAFAGTGAIGLEALSRGAAQAVFIEDDGQALAVLRQNVARCRREEQVRILRRDARRPPRAPAPCDLVFLDPPYGRELAVRALVALDEAGWIASGALAVVQCHPEDAFDLPAGFTLLDDRTVGAARFVFVTPRRGTAPSG